MRRSPHCSERPTRSAGSRSAPTASSRRLVGFDGRVAALVARGGEAVVEVELGGGGRLGQDLGVLEVEAAAEGEPAGGEHELAAAAVLDRQRAGAHRGRRLLREALGPLQRQAQLGGAPLGRLDHPRGVRRDRRPGRAGRRWRWRASRQVTCGNASCDALGRQVAERAGEIDEALRARRPRAPLALAPRVEADDRSHAVRERARVGKLAVRFLTRSGTLNNPEATVLYAAYRYMVRNGTHPVQHGGSKIPGPPPPKRHPYDQWSPDARALDLVGDKWTLLIIRDLASGPRRFVELQRTLPGISTEQLRSRLNRMVADGLLTRQRYREVPPRVDYELTERSRELAPVVGAARPLGLRLDLVRAARRRGDQHRRDLPLRARPARAAGLAARHGRDRLRATRSCDRPCPSAAAPSRSPSRRSRMSPTRVSAAAPTRGSPRSARPATPGA